MTEQAPETPGQELAPEEERKPVVFAVRIDPVLREQIEGLRGITEQSVNDVGVEALNDWVTKTLTDEAISQKAMAELDAEEKRLQERRANIAGILGQTATAGGASGVATSEPNNSPNSRRGKARPGS
ncbi:hypothetical protein [Streptomyces griseorubiginosus]|uniref:hypothetical protein n=1 Tax=Streptomyces griseorubiginosus TaxID=67304 RepID=UPI002E80F20E|nr:hypothetical protein [Streptomyces griseorubiginosus]WUB46453.1 hypothetical protein OHN19_25215 [Streptomyces griseorubiginosus]WUB54974.1 hypothetical protein OG942_25220 [Streptomyces griseorubiginosus]